MEGFRVGVFIGFSAGFLVELVVVTTGVAAWVAIVVVAT